MVPLHFMDNDVDTGITFDSINDNNEWEDKMKLILLLMELVCEN